MDGVKDANKLKISRTTMQKRRSNNSNDKHIDEVSLGFRVGASIHRFCNGKIVNLGVLWVHFSLVFLEKQAKKEKDKC